MKVVKTYPEVMKWSFEFRYYYTDETIKRKVAIIEQFVARSNEGSFLNFRQDFQVSGVYSHCDGKRTEDFHSSYVVQLEKVRTASSKEPWALLATTDTGHQFALRFSQQAALKPPLIPVFHW